VTDFALAEGVVAAAAAPALHEAVKHVVVSPA
jgi:hypothetical protein